MVERGGCSGRPRCKIGALTTFEQSLEDGKGASREDIWRRRVFWAEGAATAKAPVPGLVEEQPRDPCGGSRVSEGERAEGTGQVVQGLVGSGEDVGFHLGQVGALSQVLTGAPWLQQAEHTTTWNYVIIPGFR